jgi:hypothetical protein
MNKYIGRKKIRGKRKEGERKKGKRKEEINCFLIIFHVLHQ